MKSHNKMHTHNNAYENKELVYKTLKDLVTKNHLLDSTSLEWVCLNQEL